MTAGARNSNSVFKLDVDRRSPIPVYIQISDAIRAKIQSGKLPADSVLPPSEQICEELGITRVTLRQAYTVLAREGLLDAQRGRGTFVRRSRVERTLGQMVGFSEEMRAWGKKPSSKTLAFERTDPSRPAREFLGGRPVYRMERLRLADEVPMAIEEVEIPIHLCPDLEEFDLAKRSLYEVLDEVYHLRLVRCEQIVSASLPTGRQRKILDIGSGVALLNVTRRSFTRSDEAASYGVTQYRGDLYTASVHGERAHGMAYSGGGKALMKYRWELLLWLWLAFFFNQADRQVFNVVLPLLRHDLGLSDVQLGLIGSVFVVANGLMVPVAGFLGDIVSRKRIVVVSLFAWSLATLCTGFGATLLYFLVVRSLATAVGEAFFFPSAVAMLAFEHEKTRARALSLFQTSVYLGLIASGWLGGALAERYGWRSVFWIFGSIGMALSLALFRRVRDVRPATPEPSASQIAASARAILSQPVARYIAIASAATIFVNIGYLAWMPAYLFERFQMPLAKAGLTSMLFHHALAFAGVILGGMISDRYAPGRPRIRMEIQGFALLAGAPFLFLLGRAATEWMAYGALAGFGFFRGLFESNLYPAFYSVISARYHSAASGLLIAFSFLMASAAPVLLGKVKETAGLASGISALSAFYVAGAVAAFAGSRRLC